VREEERREEEGEGKRRGGPGMKYLGSFSVGGAFGGPHTQRDNCTLVDFALQFGTSFPCFILQLPHHT
jgi:hypothetical protein